VANSRRSADRAARFGEVFASREYVALYCASTLSWVGDFLAKAAVTALVYQQTGSEAAAAAAFAISFMPWVFGGPILAAVAERYPDRSILVVADICRAALMCSVAIPGLPTPALIALLFATSCFNPPFQAARSALLPRVLHGDRLTLALAVNFTTMQAAQACGYVLGGALAAHHARTAILGNAASFALSAALIGFGIRARPAGVSLHERTGLLRETADGFRLVFSSRTLRGVVIVVLAAIAFPVIPEGMAAGWAATFSDDPSHRGPIQGMIMLASPVGAMLCGILFNRLVAPASRRRLAPLFAMLTPLCLVPAIFSPPWPAVVMLSALTTFLFTGLWPTANGMFAQALPNAFRARASGVVQAGSQLIQGASVLAVGLIAEHAAIPVVVGVWGVVGVGVMAIACAWWPSAATFDRAVKAAADANTTSPVISRSDVEDEADERPTMPAARPDSDEDTPSLGTLPAWRAERRRSSGITGMPATGRHRR
jgi:MFS family permease